MRWGVCCGSSALGGVPQLLAALQEANADYVEFGAAEVADQAAFEGLLAQFEGQPFRPEAWNSFVPPQHRLTGPDVNLGAALDYCRTTLERCRALGGEIMVLGSGRARSVPEGFDPQEAHRQFLAFCRELAPIAQATDIIIVIEPLNRREDNLINSVTQGAALVDEVSHPHLQLLADLYHMTEDDEPMSNVAGAGPRLRHTHGADLGRVAPGYAPQGEAQFREFFAALRRAGYEELGAGARFSFEGRFEDIKSQLSPMLGFLRQRWHESAA